MNSCFKGEQLSFLIQGLRNPPSVKPIENLFTVKTFTFEGYAIDKGIIENAVGL
jgi:hypothetical protein